MADTTLLDRDGAGQVPNATRSFPDFVVIGAMRAGTTTLYHLLNQHPRIGMSRMKETDFFIPKMNYPLGHGWYRSQFAPGFDLYGEVSPNYGMCHLWRGVPRRIKETAPDARLIFLARDPVDRFVSHYLTVWHSGRQRIDPDQLLDSEGGRNILATSCYTAQIGAYLEHFPRDRLLVLDFDELRTDPQAAMDRVADFLGVARFSVAEPVTSNDVGSIARLPGFVQRAWRSRVARRLDRFISRGMRDRARSLLSVGPRRSDPAIGPELRARVAELLADDAAAFRKLTGMPFPGWKV